MAIETLRPDLLVRNRSGIPVVIAEVKNLPGIDLAEAEMMRRQIESYREDMDTVLKWLSENTVADRTARTPTKVLYTNYEYWCGKRSRPGRPVYAQSRQMFARTLTHKGFRLVKGNRGARTRRGVRLNRSAV